MKLQEVLTLYKKSVDWGLLAHNSKTTYNAAFEHLRPFMQKDIADIKRRDILRVRDALMDRPGLSNTVLTATSRLLGWAVEHEYLTHNVALRIKRQRLGELRAWSNAEIKSFLDVATGYVRTAFLLALYTGQRRVDIFKMMWMHYDGMSIRVSQQKTGVKLIIPCHRVLKEELDSLPKTGEYIMTTDGINRYGRTTFGEHWKKTMKAAGLHGVGLTFHGLRKTSAKKMAEAGCSVHEIMAVTGHTTIAMVQKYTTGAEQERRANNALKKMYLMEQGDTDE
jgi:integrase